MKIAAQICAALAMTAAILPSQAAQASSVVNTSCDSVTNGDAAGCLFAGNINESPDPTHRNGYKNAEAAYNNWAASTGNPAITLEWLTSTDAGDFGDFGSFTGNGTTGGTFSLPGLDVSYYAVKAGNQFVLYEKLEEGGSGAWSTGSKMEVSHIAFFGVKSAVPEPGTWAMMLLGFGAIGVSMRRRKPLVLLQAA